MNILLQQSVTMRLDIALSSLMSIYQTLLQLLSMKRFMVAVAFQASTFQTLSELLKVKLLETLD